MKILCVCEGGNVRSVMLAFILKDKYKQDALSMGWGRNSESTKEMLFEWAEIIILMQDVFKDKVPEKYSAKVRVVEVGQDQWGIPANSLYHNLREIDFKEFLKLEET